MNIGIINKRAMKSIHRPTYYLQVGEEFILRSGNRSFIIRGTGPGTLQVFDKEYVSETRSQNLFAGTSSGIVVGKTFSIGYEYDIVDRDIERIDI